MVDQKTSKSAKIFTLENSRLYSTLAEDKSEVQRIYKKVLLDFIPRCLEICMSLIGNLR